MKKVEIPKRGGKRLIYVPTEEEKRELRGIYYEKLYNRSFPDEVQGFVPGRGPVTNAEKHVGYDATVSFDLKDFFQSVKESHIKGKVPKEIIDKVFVDGAPQQGLPTSPVIANIAALGLDKAIKRYMKKKKIDGVYTRYADDLTISLNDLSRIPELLKDIPRIVSNNQFKLNERKTRVQYAKNGRRIITGISVGEYDIQPSRYHKRKYRAMVHRKNWKSAKGMEQWLKMKEPVAPEEKRRRQLERNREKILVEEANRILKEKHFGLKAKVVEKYIKEVDRPPEQKTVPAPPDELLLGMFSYTVVRKVKGYEGEWRIKPKGWAGFPINDLGKNLKMQVVYTDPFNGLRTQMYDILREDKGSFIIRCDSERIERMFKADTPPTVSIYGTFPDLTPKTRKYFIVGTVYVGKIEDMQSSVSDDGQAMLYVSPVIQAPPGYITEGMEVVATLPENRGYFFDVVGGGYHHVIIGLLRGDPDYEELRDWVKRHGPVEFYLNVVKNPKVKTDVFTNLRVERYGRNTVVVSSEHNLISLYPNDILRGMYLALNLWGDHKKRIFKIKGNNGHEIYTEEDIFEPKNPDETREPKTSRDSYAYVYELKPNVMLEYDTSHFIITNDPVYLIGASSFTTGWKSCLNLTSGSYRKGIPTFQRHPGISIAAEIDDKKKVTIAGVTRSAMISRAWLYHLRDGDTVYGYIYPKNNDVTLRLKKWLEDQGIYKAEEASGKEVKGYTTHTILPYLDNVRAVSVTLRDKKTGKKRKAYKLIMR